MRSLILYFLVLILPASLLSQVTSSSTFKYIYEVTPEYDLITQSHNYRKRANCKIKTIVREKLAPKNYLDSLIDIDPIKNFVENHIGTIEYFNYNRDGFLLSLSLIPQNVKLSKKDSAEHRYVKIKSDSLKNEFIINYYYNNNLYLQEIYINGLLNEEISPKYRFNLGWTDKNKINHDTTYFCDIYVKYKYNDKGLLITKEYNNTEYHIPERLCDIIEHENYAYEGNKIVITKFPFKEQPRDNDKYINVIILNKNQQVSSSTFYINDLNERFEIYTCKYDKKNNLKAVYESHDSKKPKSNILYRYKNFYEKGKLKKIIETCPGFNMTYEKKLYFFDEKGLLEKIKYIGKDWEGTELYKYTFY